MLISFLKRYNIGQIIKLFTEEYIGFLLRYWPGYEGMFLRWLLYKITFKKIGGHSLIWPNVFITHSYNISAGSYFAVNTGVHIDGRGGIIFGDHVLIGPNVFIGSSNHVIVPDPKPRIFLGHVASSVKIGDNVWIGSNTVICPGVTIDSGSIIGAGSVVTSDIPCNVLAAGNPAKVIKSLKS